MNENKTEPLLDVKNLNVSINSIPIIHDISFSLNSSETVAIIGESGSGKSITACSLLRLFSKNLNVKISGQAFYDNTNLIGLNEANLRQIRGKHIAMVFQQALCALNPVMKIGKQIREAILHNQSLSKKQAKEHTLELLDYVGILNPELRYNDYPHMLSGGMKQRIIIAIALACKPKILIADEPTTSLDIMIQDQIMLLLDKIKSEQHLSTLLISHNLGLVAKTADRIYVMKNGKIVEEGTTDKVFKTPEHPYTQLLIHHKQGLQWNV